MLPKFQSDMLENQLGKYHTSINTTEVIIKRERKIIMFSQNFISSYSLYNRTLTLSGMKQYEKYQK